MTCYNAVAGESRSVGDQPAGCACPALLTPERSIPVCAGSACTRSHCAMHLLGCLDTLTAAQKFELTVCDDPDAERQSAAVVYTKDDFSVVNRFESHGGGWGYSGHSIEAVRFSVDTDVLLGGFGLFGGRGEYFGKIKVFELGGVDSAGENEPEGEQLAETEEMPYRCAAREKFSILFEEPVALQAGHWYVAWARISGPSSDCGSSGLASVTTDDQ